MSTLNGLLEEIEKRRKTISALELEIVTLQRSVDVLRAGTNTPSIGTGALPSDLVKTFAMDVANAHLWQKKADEILADGNTHELKDLAQAAALVTPYAGLERIRKSLHVWLTRRVEKGEIEKLERGEYRLVPARTK